MIQRPVTTQADIHDLHGSWSCPVRHLDPHSQLTSPHHDPALWSGRRRWWAHHTDMGIVEGHFGGSYEVNGPIAVAQHTDSALTCWEAAGQARPVGPPKGPREAAHEHPPAVFGPGGPLWAMRVL